MELSKIPYQGIGLGKGFVTEHFSGCSLKLQNTTGLIPSAVFAEVNPTIYGEKRDFFSNLSRDQKPTYLELLIPLYDLSHKKGKRPYLLSNNPKKAERYGKWVVQLKAKRGVPVRLIATDEKGRIENIDGHMLTFVLDNEISARKFDSDFRQAIKVCSSFDPDPKPELPPGIIVN